MVHALRSIHRSIRRGGAMLDVHPQPQFPQVCVLRGRQRINVGHIDWTGDNAEIRAARRRLDALTREGLFAVERRTRFQTSDYYDSVDEWLRIRKERGATSLVPPETIRRARAEMRRGGDKLCVVLRVRAILFGRVGGARVRTPV